MTVWDERAVAYRESEVHREGPDLDVLVEWAAGARTALDVATGGGHVARRLRDAGLEVTTCDASPAMEPDVVCDAAALPFADESFDVVATRVAAHHFDDVEAAVGELARVSRDRVLVVDNLYVDEATEEAERLRDPSHVRTYSEAEWRALLEGAGLVVDEARRFEKSMALEPWLERTGCRGPDAERVRRLLAPRITDGTIPFVAIALRARRAR